MSDHESERLAPELLRLLAAEKSRPVAAGPLQARVLERLGAEVLAELPVAGPPIAALTRGPHVPRLAGLRWFHLPVALGLVAVGGLGGAGLHAWLQKAPQPAQPPSVVAPSAAPPVALPARVPEVSPDAGDQAMEGPVESRRTSVPAKRATATAPSAETAPGDAQGLGRDRELAAERALLEEARAALAHGNPAEALGLLARHARDFKKGRLSEERDALTILALVAGEQSEAARSAAIKFKRRYPRSMLSRSIEEALGTPP